MWLKELTIELYKEYQYRYDKLHKSGELIKALKTPSLLDIEITKMAQAMPEQYKNQDIVTAYRDYYRFEKQHLVKYTKRNIPEFLV